MERIVVITGGSSGIGKAIAERFAATGTLFMSSPAAANQHPTSTISPAI